MTHFREIPLDAGAHNGCFHGLRAADGTFHSGRWDSGTNLFVYSNDVPIGAQIIAYNARVTGNPSEERTA